jgi:acyl carrier protein
MLDLDLDLEADLGIDTVKQAEMFAAIRATYGIPRDQDLKLRDFPTLAHVIKFAVDRQPGAAATPAVTAVAAAAPPTTAVEAPAPVAATVVPSPVSTGAVAPVAEPVVAQAPTEDSIKEKVLEIVAEKTGYPKDMLDLDLDLEADLGIDTVKQAEMFAAIRATYGIPRDQDLKLRDFPTLAHVIKFAVDRQPRAAATPAVTVAAAAPPPATTAEVPSPASGKTTAPAPMPSAMATPTEDSIKEKVLEIVAEKTGYPKDMLDLDLDLEADLGIDTVKQAEMFAAIRATYGIPRDQDLKLRDFPTLAHVIKFAVDR